MKMATSEISRLKEMSNSGNVAIKFNSTEWCMRSTGELMQRFCSLYRIFCKIFKGDDCCITRTYPTRGIV